jgi:hypothetical protein
MASNFATKNVFAALVAESEDEDEKDETEAFDVSDEPDFCPTFFWMSTSCDRTLLPCWHSYRLCRWRSAQCGRSAKYGGKQAMDGPHRMGAEWQRRTRR